MNEYCTVREAAEKLGLSQNCVRHYCGNGRIKAVKKERVAPMGPAKVWHVLKSDLPFFKSRKYSPPLGSHHCAGLRETIHEYLMREKSYLNPEQYIELIKVRLRQKEIGWETFFGAITREDLLALNPERLHSISQRLQVFGLEIREQRA
ncbi:MAG: hypothetical protein IEMM0008_0089 [bacterium]|nr:MAG: hypothetical protein IEMM0008_0089 [bacterium]